MGTDKARKPLVTGEFMIWDHLSGSQLGIQPQKDRVITVPRCVAPLQ